MSLCNKCEDIYGISLNIKLNFKKILFPYFLKSVMKYDYCTKSNF